MAGRLITLSGVARQVARTAVERSSDAVLRALDAPPDMRRVQQWLDLARRDEERRALGVHGAARPYSPLRGSAQAWHETIYNIIADGTAVTAAAETILVPDYTISAGYMYQGRALRYTLFGRMSSPITTPGTFTHRQRWGGVGGVSMAASGAWVPDVTAASTNIAWWVEYFTVCRSIGTSGTTFTMGRMSLSDYDDAAVANLKVNLDMMQFPDVPAVATVDTTIDKALSATVQPSLNTGSVTCHIAMLDSLS